MQYINPRLFSWASILDENAKDQAVTSSSMPFIFPHIALMPDAHLGKGATVGSVIPTMGAIMPAAVGVDIGCGMMAVRTQWTKQDLEGKDLSQLRHSIERSIPLSAGGYNKELTPTAQISVEALSMLAQNADFNPGTYAGNWQLQLGSLGSGNHFIEITLDEQDRVWLFLHSGSRGIGNKIATAHIKIAQGLMKKWFIPLPDPDLAYLVEGTDEFHDYIKQMEWAQEFALRNRKEMMIRVMKDMRYFMGEVVIEQETINTHHNFTQKEVHGGKAVWLSRKGAIDAHAGVLGLVPGSMGTASYVVEGLGNEKALHSSPHGAGRVHSRSAARKTFTHEQLREAMKGIEYRDTDAFVDEIPGAYKDIDVVMEDAKDLVKVVHTLRQIVNIKGD